MARFSHIISAIDSHTAGEPARIITSGLPSIRGATMAEKWQYAKQHLDHFRTALMHEPRGHTDMFGAILTTPTTPRADFGLIFMDSGGFLTMCGHGTIAAATVLVEMGIVPAQEPETVITFDTPAGLVETHAEVKDDKVMSIWFENVPAFLYAPDVEITVPGLGRVTTDIAFGGNFFALVSADQLALPLEPGNVATFIDYGLRIREAANRQISVQHPTEKHIHRIELVEFTGKPRHSEANAKNLVVFGRGSVDRSPCGTGTCAKMAALYAKGELALGEPFVHEGIVGTLFHGRLERTIRLGDVTAVIPRVAGSAYIVGIQQFVIDPDDPLRYGFLLGR